MYEVSGANWKITGWKAAVIWWMCALSVAIPWGIGIGIIIGFVFGNVTVR